MSRESRRQNRRETGDSLIELLAAVAIISIALTTFIVALSTGALGVRHSNRLTTANNLALSQLETVKGLEYDNTGTTYAAISAPANYGVLLSTQVISPGLQQLTVTITYAADPLVTLSDYKVER
ncbi:MAG TPA: hypothetical protein G4N98_10650 [Thermoflexia bacterium]|nr:hypothetical protein [Thermoflexia bacterium]